MKVTKSELKKTKVKLVIKLEPDEMVPYFLASFEKVAPTVKLDGFRPGKAPRKLVEEAAGVSRIMSEALDEAVSHSYYHAVQQEKMIPVSSPKIVINKYPTYGLTKDEVKGEFEFEVEIDVLPEVTLGDFSKLRIEKGEPKKVKKEDVEKVLAHFRKQSATLEDSAKPAEKGDRVELNFEGFLKKVRIDAMCSKNHPLILGEGSLIPGFEENILGMKKDEKKEFKIKFPADYHSKEFAGKEAEFKIELLDVKKVVLPELDQKFAEKFGHKGMDELKKAIEENLEKEMKESFELELENKAVEKVLPLLKAEIPESLVKKETERMVGDYAAQLTARGLNFEKYLEGMKKTKEDFEKDMYPQAEKNVRVGLLLGKIIDKENIDHHDQNAAKKAIKYLVSELTK